MADYHKIGLLVQRDGRILLCRKKHSTSLLILPGGRVEPGETPLECLVRELREELGDVELIAPEYVGVYTDRAAGATAGQTVEIQLYRGSLRGEPAAHAEIAELVWFGGSDDWSLLAPSLANKILPDLMKRAVLAWPPRGRR